jgi:hypothetical protein
VDLFGLPADWPAIQAICAKTGMFALDDAAQAFGARLHGRRLGCWADATALSFYPTKTLGCYGDGGALLTDSAERAELYRSLRTHGEGGSRYEVMRTGMNGRLDTLQAAILLCKLGLFEQELADRRRWPAGTGRGSPGGSACRRCRRASRAPGGCTPSGCRMPGRARRRRRGCARSRSRSACIPEAAASPAGLRARP